MCLCSKQVQAKITAPQIKSWRDMTIILTLSDCYYYFMQMWIWFLLSQLQYFFIRLCRCLIYSSMVDTSFLNFGPGRNLKVLSRTFKFLPGPKLMTSIWDTWHICLNIIYDSWVSGKNVHVRNRKKWSVIILGKFIVYVEEVSFTKGLSFADPVTFIHSRWM